MQSDWKVFFDSRAFIARYPDLFVETDDDLWEDWAKCVAYDRSELHKLIINPKVSIRFKARAAVTKNCPHEFQPFHWGKGKKSGYDDHHYDREVNQQIQQLTFDLRCSFMESLPQSPAFDLSKHPMLRRIWQMNLLLIKYLSNDEEDHREWIKPLRQRAFDCFRLQGQCPDYYMQGLKPFAAFYHLMYQREGLDMRWKRKAVRKIWPMIEKEAAGEEEYQGALTAFLRSIEYRIHWDPDPDLAMGPEPISVKLEAEMMGLLLGLNAPLETRVPEELLYGFRGAFIGADRLDLLHEIGRQYLVERPHNEGTRNTVSLAKAVVELLEDDQVKQAALEHIAIARAGGGLAPRDIAAQSANVARVQKLESILRRMEN